MKLEAQRIAIAEACGWDCDPLIAREWKSRGQWARKTTDDQNKLVSLRSNVPDYLNDLNAMHEAEKVLYGNPNLPKKYTQQIKNAIRREAGVTKAQMDFDVCITATAAQRAEAFLRTIEKWVETNSTKEPACL
jgi:hypothetical protein